MHTAFLMHNTSSGLSLCIQLSPVVGQTTNGCHDRGRKCWYSFLGTDGLNSEKGQETQLRVFYKFGDAKNSWKSIYFHDLTNLAGLGHLRFEVPWSHSDTPQSVGLPWTSDQPEAHTSTWQHATLTRDIHESGGIRTRSTSKWTVADPRLTPRDNWDRKELKCWNYNDGYSTVSDRWHNTKPHEDLKTKYW